MNRNSQDTFASTKPKRPWRPTLHEMRTYNQLFLLVDERRTGVAGETAVRKLLAKSALHPAYTERIWQLSTNSNKACQMGKQEFFTAMKMVALAQSGRPVSLANLHEFASLPTFTGVNVRPSPSQAVSKSSLLRYSPQPTVGLDDIITKGNSSQSSLASTANITPPRSPVSTVMYLDDYEPADDTDSLSMLTPELRQPLPSSPPNLQVDTKLATAMRSIQNSPELDDQTTPLSTDSITELLSRIDLMITSSHNTQQRSMLETQIHSASNLRSELESKISELQTACTQEQMENDELTARLSSEESQIKVLTAQIDRARKHIAYVARQRAQLVERLQYVEKQQSEMRMRLQNTEKESGQCSKDVDKLDIKVFGMERNHVHMQRHAKFQQAKAVPAAATYGYSSNNPVLVRYQTAKRNRLSSVFRSPAMAK
ncbi:hypothetical protein IWW36_000569 [Coemansia brasiliensis]|uniref:EH domain-containing protein n=1 Tax=Coemansia brasiliensis TaxID=2650707 RepID=A0A9W8LZS3_9FUNG|nr:hypothetical protein IWW36_000569 [Coemansia brasiliensis]